MKKRSISFLLSIAMIVALLPRQTIARADALYCGENLTYTEAGYVDTAVTISGVGAMYDYAAVGPENYWDPSGKSPWSFEVKTVVIEEGATSIGKNAFYSRYDLTSVTIPVSVTSIGAQAFFSCYNLKDVYYGGSEADWANISISSTQNNHLLDAVIHYNSDIPGGETEPPETTEPAQETEPPETTAPADAPAADQCGDNAFWELTGDRYELTLTISGTGDMYDYGDGSYPGWRASSYKITEIVIGEGITSIGNGAFSSHSALIRVTIPGTVTRIGDGAFAYCSDLKRLDIPKSVTSIGTSAFSSCSSLANVYYEGSEAAWAAIEIGSGNADLTDATIHYGEETAGASASGICGDYANWTLNLDTGVLTVSGAGRMTDYQNNGYAPWYDYKDAVRRIVIGEGITSVGDCTFWAFSNVQEVVLPEGLTRIGNHAFTACTNLEKINIPESLTYIGDYAFNSCKRLSTITIPDGATYLGKYAFHFCTGLTSVTIPESITEILSYTFYECRSLTNVRIPDSVTAIGGYAFRYCKSLTEIVIPEGVTSISRETFYGCENLASITIPCSVTEIMAYAFYKCAALTDVYYGGSEEEWAAVTIGTANTPLTGATIHYNGSGGEEAPEEWEIFTDVRYYYSYNERESRVYFGPNDLYGCLITEETDSGFRGDPTGLQGKFVVIEYRIVEGQELLLTMVQTQEDLTVKEYAFRFTGNLAPDRDITSNCFYTDGYFLMDSEVYNPHLSTMSLCFDLTTWSRSPGSGAKWSEEVTIGEGTNHRAQNAYDLLVGQLGFSDFRLSDDWEKSPGKDTIGAVAASKMLPDGSRLIALGIRGGGYTREWASNFTVGKAGDHAGFTQAKDEVLAFLHDYIAAEGITGPIKLWIVGYSRGGCVAGMVAGELNRNSTLLSGVSLDHNDLFCYTFEAPQGTLSGATAVGDHSNIHNIVNLNDIVPLVAPSDWGFDRYSTDRYLPSAATSDDWLTDYLEMVKFYYTFVQTDKDGNVSVPEYSVKENCKQFVLEIYWENLGFDDKPLIKKYEYFVPMQMVLNDATDFIFRVVADDREDYYFNLQDPLCLFLGIAMAESKLDAAGDDIRSLDALELLNMLADELLEKERILHIVEPMFAPGEGSLAERISKVEENLDAFIKEKVEDAALGSALKELLWSVLKTCLEDLYHLNVQSLKNVLSFFGSLGNVGNAHYSEVALCWLMSQDSYYNPNVGDFYDCAVPSSRVVRINCPVDVKVYRTATGELVAAITGDAAQEIAGSSIYAYVSPDGEKTVVLPSDAEYTVQITATAEGTFNYTISEYCWASRSNSRVLSYRDIPVSEGDVFEGTLPEFTEGELSAGIPNGSSADYVLTGADGGEIGPDDELTGTEAAEAVYTVRVTSNVPNGSISGGGSYTYGSFAQVAANPLPDEKFLGWYQGDVLVSGENVYRFAVTQDVELTARFSASGYAVYLDPGQMGEGDSAWVDGKQYPITFDGTGAFVNIPNTDATNMVVYSDNDPNAADIHTQYPTGMRVWMLKFENGAYTATYVPEFDNLLQYSGSSIRIVGVKGIRMITSIDKDVRNSLINGGLAGYTLVEYGTALAWVSDLDENNPLVLGRDYTKSNFAYKRGEADPIFARVGNLIQYTNVLVGFNDDQCIPDIAMRPYIILEDAEGQQVTVYGGQVVRSIGYIAWQNRNVFQPGNAAYDYVWGIIHHVYGDQYDEDFKG